MKKIFLTIGLALTSFGFFAVKANASTTDWTETQVVEIEIEIDFNEMNAEQIYKLFNFLFENNFIFYNGEYQIDVINYFYIDKEIYIENDDIYNVIIIEFNNDEIIIEKPLNGTYTFLVNTYFNWLILNGDIEITKGIYNIIYDIGWYDGYDDGYEIGYFNGYGTGLDIGRDDGWTVGNDYGYINGYNDGFNDGFNDGYNDGILQGENQGFIDGYQKGLEIGEEHGENNGYNQGTLDSKRTFGIFYGGEWLTAEEYANIRVKQTINEIGNADDNKIGLIGFIPSILGSIGAFFFTLASFEVMGISLMDIIALFASLALIILVIKLIKGGD